MTPATPPVTKPAAPAAYVRTSKSSKARCIGRRQETSHDDIIWRRSRSAFYLVACAAEKERKVKLHTGKSTDLESRSDEGLCLRRPSNQITVHFVLHKEDGCS
mgnify:FL=1